MQLNGKRLKLNGLKREEETKKSLAKLSKN